MPRYEREEDGAEEDGRARKGRARRPRGLVWTGSISFGLVNIPVTLHAGDASGELRFSLLDQRDNSPIGYQKINKSTGEPVPNEEIVKAFQYGPDRYVTLTEDDFKRASPERTQRIDIERFVDLKDISPEFFERPYYLEPAPKSEKAYALLREAMRRTGKVGIATVVLRAREHLCALLPRGRMLELELLRYPSELRDPGGIRLPEEDLRRLKVTEAEVKMAERLVSELSGPWDPSAHRDEYREELLAYIEKKVKQGRVETVPELEAEEAAPPPADIMALLKKSLGQGARVRGDGRRARLH